MDIPYATQARCPLVVLLDVHLTGAGVVLEGLVAQAQLQQMAARGDAGAVVHLVLADLDLRNGQMDAALLPDFVAPILAGEADYTKGNRFFDLEQIRQMPGMRLFGNAVLSFMTKLSCGYWNVMDPTNGYTAVRTCVLAELPLDKLESRYFFETDMLFRLNTVRAVVKDVPMDSVYADEESNLKIGKVLPEFLRKHASRLWRRYVYNYLVRDFNVGTLYSLFGSLLVVVGSVFGAMHWLDSALSNHPATSGTVMLAALPILVGIQFLIAFLHYDVSNLPVEPLSHSLAAPQSDES